MTVSQHDTNLDPVGGAAWCRNHQLFRVFSKVGQDLYRLSRRRVICSFETSCDVDDRMCVRVDLGVCVTSDNDRCLLYQFISRACGLPSSGRQCYQMLALFMYLPSFVVAAFDPFPGPASLKLHPRQRLS